MLITSLARNARGISLRVVALATVLAAGCGHEAAPAQPPSPPRVTSAPLPAASEQATNERVAQLETERDQAKRQAADAQSRLAAERERSDREMSTMKARDDFADATWKNLDQVEMRVKALRTELPKMALARRTKVEKLLHDIDAKRSTVEQDIHRIHAIPAANWDSYTRDVDASVRGIDADVSSAESQR